MDYNTKSMLIDLAHLLHQAIITDDDAIAAHTLGQAADALASLMPLEGEEKAKARGEGEQRRSRNDE